ncbi:MAG: discoidin domain-containing protein [Actinobacteria bacterium]|nr:discoidin domain-containing protein [Actinomycetota bacterium]
MLTASALVGGHPAVASDVAHGAPVRSWITDLASGQRLAAQAPQRWLPGPAPAGTTVVVDPTRRYQTMTGFGASMTDSSAYVLNKLPAATRDRTMADLFSPATGIGMSMLRNPMGASDFAVNGSYSYDDQPAGATDPTLADFSITHDNAYILPLLRQAQRLNPQLAMMGTPWSPPGWMKTSGSMVTGSFLPQYFAAYAKYFVKYLQGYAAAGVPVRFVSAQNEPLYEPATYPGMNFPAAQEATFIGDYLGPALRRAGLDTRILGYDHNWDVLAYPEQLYADPSSAAYVPGTAWHCYAGDMSAQTSSHNDYPHAQAFETECSGGTWQGTDAQAFSQTMQLLIGVPRNWGQSVVLWNLALDDNRGPQNNGCDTCRGVVTVHADGTVTKELDYWALGQVTRFVHPGATRIASSQPGGLWDVAYTNPDGTGTLVAYNPTTTGSQLSIQVGKQHVTTTLAAGAAATYTWAQPARLAPADPATLGSVDLDLGPGPRGTPTGRLDQTINSDVLASLNQVRLGDSWLAYSQPYGATVSGGPVTMLARSGWTVTTSSTDPASPISNMTDGDPNTRWSSGQGQAPGMWVQLDLGAPATFNQISLDVGPNTGDYVRNYQVQTSPDGSTWTAIAAGAGRPGIMTIPLPTTTARFVRLVSEASSGSWWSITELNIGVSAGSTSSDSGDLRTATATFPNGPAGVPAQIEARYNAGDAAATVAFPLAGFDYAYTLPPTAAVTFATWPAS